MRYETVNDRIKTVKRKDFPVNIIINIKVYAATPLSIEEV